MVQIDIAMEMLSAAVPACPEGYSNKSFFRRDARKRTKHIYVDANAEYYLGGYPDVPFTSMQSATISILDLARDFSPRELNELVVPQSVSPWMIASLILSNSDALSEEEHEVNVYGRSEKSLAYNIFWVGGHEFAVIGRKDEYYICPGYSTGLPRFRSGNRLILLSAAQ